MEDNIQVTEVTENVETTTEETVETVKTYTEEEVNAIVGKRLARQKAKLQREIDERNADFREAEMVLNAGLGTSNIKDATGQMRNFYEKKGVKIPTQTRPEYSNDELQVLASNEAQKIIESGIDEVIEEVDRLADLGIDNMTPREKLVFTQLAEYRKADSEKKELAKIGVKPEALQDPDFLDFAANLDPKMSTKDKYNTYLKYRPAPQVRQIGSMKQGIDNGTGVKEFYSREEALKYTVEDFNKNPALYQAVLNSMPKWGK